MLHKSDALDYLREIADGDPCVYTEHRCFYCSARMGSYHTEACLWVEICRALGDDMSEARVGDQLDDCLGEDEEAYEGLPVIEGERYYEPPYSLE